MRKLWKSIRKLRDTMEEDDDWQENSKEEIDAVKTEDRKERVGRLEEMKRRYGAKNVRKKETKQEKKINDDKQKEKIEIVEIKKTLMLIIERKLMMKKMP